MEPVTKEDTTLERVNFEQLKRKCMFQSGQLTFEKEYVQPKAGANPKAKKVYKSAFDMPDVMPVKLVDTRTEEQTIEEQAEETKMEDALKLLPASGDEQYATQKQAIEKPQNFTFSGPDSKPTEAQMSRLELVKMRKVTYELPILIIYNPSSGKQANLLPLIENRLKREKIPYEMKPTKKRHDTYFYAKEADFSKYSMLAACGGDGSYHEVINGMLARDDKLKLPVALVPNGSGNDTCTSLGIKNLDDSLNAIVNAEVLKIDTIKILMDYDNESQVPDDKKLNSCRHMIANASISMPARVAVEAIKYKKCCGKNCYAVATIQEAMLGRLGQDLYDVEVDGVKMAAQNKNSLNTILIMLFNGKFTGGGMVCNPFSCMNDGLMDIVWLHDEKVMGLAGVADMLGKAKSKGATHIYDNTCTFVRARQIKVTYLGKKGKKEPKKNGWGQQMLGVDGEDLRYDRQLTFECIPSNVEVAFEGAKFFKNNNLLK